VKEEMKAGEFGIMKVLDITTALLLVLGGLTWGVGGIIGFETTMTFLGDLGITSRIVSVLIGICSIYEVSMWKAIPRRWGCTMRSETPHPAS
jgi:hypothetical protein